MRVVRFYFDRARSARSERPLPKSRNPPPRAGPKSKLHSPLSESDRGLWCLDLPFWVRRRFLGRRRAGRQAARAEGGAARGARTHSLRLINFGPSPHRRCARSPLQLRPSSLRSLDLSSSTELAALARPSPPPTVVVLARPFNFDRARCARSTFQIPPKRGEQRRPS